ncbi:hypothetical protein O0L34_g13167 [Tuta absoluta]|nr:hypothetical protein O0L34_g13167 [Tuta absoluta]
MSSFVYVFFSTSKLRFWVFNSGFQNDAEILRNSGVEPKLKLRSSSPNQYPWNGKKTVNDRTKTKGILVRGIQRAQYISLNDTEHRTIDPNTTIHLNTTNKSSIEPLFSEINQQDPYYVIHSGEDKLEDVNTEQYDESCPTVCPARGTMVCGKCKCGVYRTFVSACHMRMFDCAHPEEKLTVVAWAPCAMSAPYLEDLHEPKGLIDWPSDKDEVLRYLKCKEYAGKTNLFPYSRLDCTGFGDKKKPGGNTAGI